MSHPAISLHQPWCQWLVTRQPCDCPAMPPPFGGPIHRDACASLSMVKGWETRSWPCPPALIGQPIAIHATQRKPPFEHIGGYTVERWYDRVDHVDECDCEYEGGIAPSCERGAIHHMCLTRTGGPDLVSHLPLGAIVGSGRITASLPIVDAGGCKDTAHVCHVGDSLMRHTLLAEPVDGETEFIISDQLPYGDFTPGRYAWLIEDAASTNERCPWCDGTGADPVDVVAKGCDRMECDQYCRHPNCPVCDGAGRCDPIPARGRQRIWNWQP